MTNNKQQTTEKPQPTRREESFDLPEMVKDYNVSQYEEVFFVKPMTKDAAYFEITKKVGDEYVINPRKDVQHIGGELIKIEFGSYIYNNEPKKVFKLHIVLENNDKKYLYIISSAYTVVGRSIINCLLDCQGPIETINITLSFRKEFANASVSINGQPSPWRTKTSGPGKYSREELNEYVIPIKHPKTGVVTSNDYTELIDFMEGELMKHVDTILPNSQHIKFVDSPLGEETNNDDMIDIDHEESFKQMFPDDVDDEEQEVPIKKKK